MPNDVLDFVRSREPRFNDVSDEELTQYIGETKPDFLKDETFAKRYALVSEKVKTKDSDFITGVKDWSQAGIDALEGFGRAADFSVKSIGGALNMAGEEVAREVRHDLPPLMEHLNLPYQDKWQSGVVDVAATTAQMAPVIGASAALTATGVPPPVSFGLLMGSQGYAKKGDVADFAHDASIGMLLGPVGEAGSFVGEGLGMRAAALTDSTLAQNAAIVGGKLAGSQVGLDAMMIADQSPELIDKWKEDPHGARVEIAKIIAGNLAFEAPHLSARVREVAALDRADNLARHPELLDLGAIDALRLEKGNGTTPLSTEELAAIGFGAGKSNEPGVVVTDRRGQERIVSQREIDQSLASKAFFSQSEAVKEVAPEVVQLKEVGAPITAEVVTKIEEEKKQETAVVDESSTALSDLHALLAEEKTQIEAPAKTSETGATVQNVLTETTSSGNFASKRKVTQEGVDRANAARQALRYIINNPDITGSARSDAIENGRNLISFLDSHADTRRPLDEGYNGGDRVAYTGEDAPEGFRSFIRLDGYRAGSTGVERTPEAKAADAEASKKVWMEQQAAFKAIRESGKSDQMPPSRKPASPAITEAKSEPTATADERSQAEAVKPTEPVKAEEPSGEVPVAVEAAPVERPVAETGANLDESFSTIYRAGDANERGVKAFSSWTEHKPVAEAYLDNPGFGGKTIRTERFPLGNVLDADTTTRKGMSDLAEKLGFPREKGDEWFDNGWRYPWEESSKVKTALSESGFDAIRYTDDFPEGAKTIVPLKSKSEPTATADERSQAEAVKPTEPVKAEEPSAPVETKPESSDKRIRNDSPEAKPIQEKIDALTKLGTDRYESAVKDTGSSFGIDKSPVAHLTRDEQRQLVDLQSQLRKPTPEEKKADRDAKDAARTATGKALTASEKKVAENRKMREDSSEVDKLIELHGPVLGLIDPSLSGAEQKQSKVGGVDMAGKMALSKQRIAARRKIGEELGLGDLDTPQKRAEALPKVREWLENAVDKVVKNDATREINEAMQAGEHPVETSDLHEGDVLTVNGQRGEVHIDPDGRATWDGGERYGEIDLADGHTLHVDGYEPAPREGAADFADLVPEIKPKLKAGERQGDLITSTQREDLALVGEKGTDHERIAAEKAKADRDKKEAADKADKEQLDFMKDDLKGELSDLAIALTPKKGAVDSLGAIEAGKRVVAALEKLAAFYVRKDITSAAEFAKQTGFDLTKRVQDIWDKAYAAHQEAQRVEAEKAAPKQEPEPTPAKLLEEEQTKSPDPAVSAALKAGIEAAKSNRGEPSTGTKNAVTDAERAALNKEPILRDARVGNEETFDKAVKVLGSNPNAATEYINELITNPDADISVVKEAILLKYKVDLQAQMREAYDRSVNSNTKSARDTARDEWYALSDSMDRLDLATHRSGQAWGRLGQFRQRTMKEDYSFDAMKRKLTMANGGDPIEQDLFEAHYEGKLREIEKKNLDQRAEIDRLTKQLEESAAERHSKQEFKLEVEKHGVKPTTSGQQKQSPRADYVPKKKLSDSIIAKADQIGADALKRIKEKLMRANVGADPSILLDVAAYGAAKIAKGTVKSAQWFSEMVSDVGDWVKPHLDDLWEKSKAQAEAFAKEARDIPAEREATVAGLGKAIERASKNGMEANIGRYVKSLQRQFIEEGMTDRGDILAAVHNTVKDILPDMKVEDVRDALSGYGKWREASKDPVDRTIREHNAQYQSDSKIQGVIEKKMAALKTGYERTPSDPEKRALEKKYKALLEEYGISTADPATQLATYFESAKTRLNNSIEDYEHAVATGEKFVIRPTPKLEAAQKAELESLQAARDKAKADYDNLFPKDPITPEEQLKRAERQAERNAEQWRKKVDGAKNGIFGKEADPNKPKSSIIEKFKKEAEVSKAEVEHLKSLNDAYQKKKAGEKIQSEIAANNEKIDAINERLRTGKIESEKKGQKQNRPSENLELEDSRAKLREANDKLNEERKKLNPKQSELEASLNRRIAAGKRSLIELRDRIETERIAPKKKAPLGEPATPKELAALKELQRLQIENAKARKEFDQMAADVQQKRLGKLQKISDMAEGFNRGNIFLSVHVLDHLLGAGVENILTRPTATLTAQLSLRALSKLPGNSGRIAANIFRKATHEAGLSMASEKAGLRGLFKVKGDPLAPRESWSSVVDEATKDSNSLLARAARKAFSAKHSPLRSITAYSEVLKKMLTGKSNLDFQFGEPGKVYPKQFMDWASHWHGAIKEPVRQGIFARTLQLNLERFQKDTGLDGALDPYVYNILGRDALDHANADIFMGDNWVTTLVRNSIGGWRATKDIGPMGHLASNAFNILAPVINVPMNIGIRKARLGLGGFEAGARLLHEYANGRLSDGGVKISVKQSNEIAAAIKYQLVGVALMAYVYNNLQDFGGSYQIGKPAPKDKFSGLKPGEIRLPGGVVLSKLATHGPWGSFMNDFANLLREVNQPKNEGAFNKVAATGSVAIMTMLGNVPGATAYNQIANERTDSSQKAGIIVRNMIIMGALQQWAEHLDSQGDAPVKRQAKTFIEEIQKGVPYWRKYLPPAQKQ